MINNKRRVQFPTESLHTVVCTIPNREDFTPEDHIALWFSKSDYHMSRSEAKVISRDATRYGFSKNLDDTFCEKSGNAQEHLQMWCTTGDCRRGLERWANREHGDRRGKDQFQAVQAVLEAQDSMLSQRDCNIDHEKLRKVSHKATRTARHFARMMGKADSYAMAHELQQDKKCDGETVATENNTVSSSVANDNCYSASSCGDSVASYSTAGTAISNPRMPAVDEADMKDNLNSHRPRFRRFGFGAKHSKREKAEDAARVSRVA